MNKEMFLKIECEVQNKYGKGCGYWYVCDDKACPCPLSNKGYDMKTYESMKKQQHEDFDNY